MKTAFLQAVAKDLIKKYGHNLANITIVFPNKRASLFMNEYLVREAQCPVWSPDYITISELFRKKSDLLVADSIKLICDLYRSYIAATGRAETLDHFYGWGQLLLADFDDIDKNMADPHQVFANLKDIHELDGVDYLTDEQKNILKKFFDNFSDEHHSKLKERFLSLWSNLEAIYTDFNHRLAEQGLAYEGALYRKVVESKGIDYESDQYIFVGFNMLQQVEQQLFSRLKEEHKVHFYWDFDTYYLQGNEAGHYISKYLTRFPNELDINDTLIYSNMDEEKDITYISSMTESAQAHYVTRWLKEKGRIEAGAKTAIVLCDEKLLQTVLHCIPEEVKNINITTGYPLSQTPVSSLVQLLLGMHTMGHIANTDKFRLREVSKVLKHPYARFISDRCIDLYSDLQNHKLYYPTRRQLILDDNLELLFTDTDVWGDNRNLNITRWLLALIKLVGRNSQPEKNPLMQESVFRMYTIINRIAGLIEAGDLEVDTITFERLISQLIQSTTVPFHGEPVQGIQIMGVLETRNLDFEHLLILSTSEGNMPKGTGDASFIPYSIRKAYGLTTIDNKVAIYAYYFNRLLQRAGDITLAYNKATEEGQAGEMSRFMLQLMVESKHNIRHLSIMPEQAFKPSVPETIEKTDAIQQLLDNITKLSPTAINRYMFCPLTFYYNVVQQLKEPDENDEEMMDNRTFGNIFHRSAELIYQRLIQKGQTIHESDIAHLLGHQEIIEMIVDKSFKEILFNVTDNSYTPEYNGLQLVNREVIISYLQKLLKIDLKLTPFDILGLEKTVETTIEVPTARGNHPIKIFGIIDRLDKITGEDGNERIRVIDYKTGMQATKKVTEISELFTGDDIQEKHTNYYLQALLYSLIVSHDNMLNSHRLPVSPGLIFIQQAGTEKYDPTLQLDKAPMIRATDYEKDFVEGLTETLKDIFNPAIPFSPTIDKKRCDTCVYRNLCKK